MDVILDGEPREIDVSDCANLAELVAATAQLETGGEDRVVVAIEVDGQPLSQDQLGALEAQPLDAVARVAIESRPSRELALSVLRQGADYAEEIVKALERTSVHFRSGRSDLANTLFAHVTDSLTVMIGIQSSAAHILPECAEELLTFQSELQPWLEALVEAQSSEDPIRIGDLLEYEVAPRVAHWGVRMRALASPAGGAGSGPAPALSN